MGPNDDLSLLLSFSPICLLVFIIVKYVRFSVNFWSTANNDLVVFIPRVFALLRLSRKAYSAQPHSVEVFDLSAMFNSSSNFFELNVFQHPHSPVCDLQQHSIC